MRWPLTAVGTLLLLLATPLGWADIYKWVDARGKVTYSNVPPPEVAAERVPEGTGRVSTYSPVVPIDKGDSGEVRQLQERVAQLERDTEALRQARAASPAPAQVTPDAQQLRDRRERCIAERRVDCDRPDLENTNDAAAGDAVAVAPRLLHPRLVQPVFVNLRSAGASGARHLGSSRPAVPIPEPEHPGFPLAGWPIPGTAYLSLRLPNLSFSIGRRAALPDESSHHAHAARPPHSGLTTATPRASAAGLTIRIRAGSRRQF